MEERAREHSWHAPTLLDNDRQVHPLMDRTIEVIGTRGGKWSDLRAVPLTCTLLTVGAPGSFANVAVPRCQEPFARIWVTATSSTRSNFEPLEMVIEDWVKLATLICTVGTPLVMVVLVMGAAPGARSREDDRLGLSPV